MTADHILHSLPWALVGALMGAAYFFLLSRGVAAIGSDGDLRKAVVFLVLRVGMAVAGFAMAATQGAGALLFALAGLLIARSVAIRRVGRG